MAIDVSVFRYYVDKGTTIGSSGGAISSGGGGVATPFDDSGLYVYVDGSFGLRDASIAWLNTNKLAYRTFGTAANNNTGDFVATYSDSGFTDLNTIITSGMYRLNTGQANQPSGTEYGQLLVIHGAADTISQIAMSYSNNLIYWRNGNPTDCGGVGSWNAWKRLWNSGDFALTDFVAVTGDTMTGDLTINANLAVSSNVKQPSFTTGWLGTNWQIEPTGDAVFENLQVRGSAKFRELIIDQLSVVGGSDLLSIARGKITSVDVANSKVTLEDPNARGTSTFAQYDFFWIKSIDIDNTLVNDCKGQISAIVGTTLTLDFSVTGHTGAITDIAVGDVIVQRGHPTIAARQNLIYRTVSDTGNPFERTIKGVDSIAAFTNLDNVALQSGNLSNLASYGILPATPGVGLYTNNGYFTGKVVSTQGTIGGWTIGTTSITDASGLVGISSARTAGDDVRFWAGGTTPATAPFRVTESGALTATGALELGTAAVGGTYFGNISIKGGQLWENSHAAESGLYINVNGYQGMNTYFRNLSIYDGKQGRVAYFNHYGLLVDLDFRVSGATILDGGIHVGGTGAPGANNLIVDGHSTINTLTAENLTSNGYIYADLGIDSNAYIWAGSNITATTTIYAGGNISGLSFTDRTPFYEGDAVAEIMAIKGKDGKIDHSTLPEFAKKTITKNSSDNKSSETETGRDLGGMISILTVAVQQLTNRIKKLESSKI